MIAQQLATDLVKKLVKAGYTAYFAGGWVRDYLMGHPSEDIDIATDAPTQVILDLFPHTILVGLAFGVVIVVTNGHQFEVATFRRDLEYLDGRKPSQIELATPEEDASRRDFTINGMFYDPIEKVIHDFVQGKEDIKHRLIRAIGDPYERFVEDRLRMIRAVRFAARFNFIIDDDTHDAIRASADTLFPAVAMERVWHEFNKMAGYPHFDTAVIEMHRLGLLSTIFPDLAEIHLNVIKKQVASFPHYPAKSPTLLYLLALFPNATVEETQDLCRYLRTSIAEANVGVLFVNIKRQSDTEKLTGSIDKINWTYFYAHPEAKQCLQVIAAHMPEEEQQQFLAFHQQHATDLAEHIQRIQQRKPLVTAALLQKHGIVPGKSMGMLLKEAERITILNNFNQADIAMDILKNSPHWSKS